MADTALENAERRRDDLAAEINGLQQQVEAKRKELDRVKQWIDDYIAFSSGTLEFELSAPEPAKAKKGKKSANKDRQIIGDYVETILDEVRRPMSRDELFDALKTRGEEIVGKDPMMVFSTMMWRMQDRFVRLPGFGYWLADKPWPPARYTPAQSSK